MFGRGWLAAAALVFMAAPVPAGPITIIDTLGPSNTLTTANPYTAQFGVNAFAVQINVAQTTIPKVGPSRGAGRRHGVMMFADWCLRL
jgi:hypothetical protein